MLVNFIVLLVGFFLLVKGADYFVDGSSNIARKLKIPSLIIGLTIVAFGTSAPEAAVSITSAIQGQNGMAMGNVIGSNVFNLLMVIGMAGFINTLHVEKSILYKEFPFLLIASLIMFILSSDMIFTQASVNTLSRFDGLIFIVIFVVYMVYLLKMALSSRNSQIKKEVPTSAYSASDASSAVAATDVPLTKSCIMSLIGILLIVLGGKMVVDCASAIASNFGVSDQLIGLTIVAIGTSLPEFVTSIIAATKGESDIALGNVIGSNMFNILFVLGASAFISPLNIEPKLIIDCMFMLFATLLTYIFAIRKKDINKFESIMLVVLYFGYMSYLIISA